MAIDFTVGNAKVQFLRESDKETAIRFFIEAFLVPLKFQANGEKEFLILPPDTSTAFSNGGQPLLFLFDSKKGKKKER